MPEEPQNHIQVPLPHFSRWRSLKQFVPTILWFIAGIILWAISDGILFPIFWTPDRFAVTARRLGSLGGDTLARYWLFFALNLINWLIAILVGIIGGVFIRRHVVRNLCSFGIAFAFVPLVLYAYDEFTIPNWHLITEHGTNVLLTVCSGMLAHHLKHGLARKSSPTPS